MFLSCRLSSLPTQMTWAAVHVNGTVIGAVLDGDETLGDTDVFVECCACQRVWWLVNAMVFMRAAPNISYPSLEQN